MKIISPLNHSKEIEPLIKAGADAFFFGFMKDNNAFSSWNHPEANFTDFDDLKKAISICNKRKIPIYCTLDIARINKQSELDEIIKRAKLFSKLGVTKFFASNISILTALKKHVPVVVGCECGVFNKATIEFYNERGFHDLVLSRYLYPTEIEIMKKAAKNTQFYVQIHDVECPINDETCTLDAVLAYGGSSTPCNFPATLTLIPKNDIMLEGVDFYSKFRHRCFLCLIYNLNKIGIEHLIIKGKGFPLENKIESVELVNSVLQDIDNLSKEGIRKIANEICIGERCLYYKKWK